MNPYGRPTTYKRITPERGSGFILKRIYELTEDPKLLHGAGSYPTKRDVYRITLWYNRPGWSSLLWSSLIKDGLIESIDGLQKVKLPRSYWHARRDSNVSYRAGGHYEPGVGHTVRYRLTPKGRGILFDMMDRVSAKGKTLNSVGSVAEHDAKKDECPVKVSEWREDDFLLPGETKEECAERNGVILLEEDKPRDFLKNMTRTEMEADRLDAQLLDHENDENGFTRDRISAAYNNVCTRRDALVKEIERREEKNDMNKRLKKIRDRLIAIGNETDLLQAELQQLIDWSSSK